MKKWCVLFSFVFQCNVFCIEKASAVVDLVSTTLGTANEFASRDINNKVASIQADMRNLLFGRMNGLVVATVNGAAVPFVTVNAALLAAGVPLNVVNILLPILTEYDDRINECIGPAGIFGSPWWKEKINDTLDAIIGVLNAQNLDTVTANIIGNLVQNGGNIPISNALVMHGTPPAIAGALEGMVIHHCAATEALVPRLNEFRVTWKDRLKSGCAVVVPLTLCALEVADAFDNKDSIKWSILSFEIIVLLINCCRFACNF
ncbi:MAG: hypothetical protein LBG80_18615 [Bacteroidales bacterium]|nr:hypothetical protein [Bacteroidales bacterium]